MLKSCKIKKTRGIAAQGIKPFNWKSASLLGSGSVWAGVSISAVLRNDAHIKRLQNKKLALKAAIGKLDKKDATGKAKAEQTLEAVAYAVREEFVSQRQKDGLSGALALSLFIGAVIMHRGLASMVAKRTQEKMERYKNTSGEEILHGQKKAALNVS